MTRFRVRRQHHASLSIVAVAALAWFCTAALYGQVEQERAALCGEQSTVKPTANIRTALDEKNGVSYVLFDVRGGTKTLTLRAVEQIQAVCSLPGNKIFIFGAFRAGAFAGYELAVANAEDGTPLDSWDAYTPVMSPDQRWLILRKFYAPQTGLTISEEYLLYPLWKIQAEERTPEDRNAEPPSGAIVVYPLGQTNAFASNIGVPTDQAHIFLSKSFFWSDDSRAVVFADSVQGSLSVVLVEINGESPTTRVYAPPAKNACEPAPNPDISMATLAEAKVGPEERSGGRGIQMRFETGSSGACKPKMVVIRTSDFQRPKPELHPIWKRKPSTPVGK